MTRRPKLRLGSSLAPGILAVGLFALMALIVLNTPFGAMPEEAFDVDSITAAIGYALFDLGPLQETDGVSGTEPFLAAFLLIALTLDAALDASLVLAKREESGEPVAALASRGSNDTPADSSADAQSRSASTDGGSATESDATDGGAD
ncbi:hypothetical protein G6M89_13280 [Natronolimnobius sp. AArcel1]|uniref:NADH-quinone oxidoreductase subunit J n=1 Tax=Natronolimnobius sp. AArcel1 TaxID=1679093 RepID=UPI0013EDC4FD|nr:NADH-quinone oxidoreductase subunit J [Natronolimnobius sp. AArcel1]NGM69972.1 hypothetical protein [Natronolimnobius sp. AArcel1]